MFLSLVKFSSSPQYELLTYSADYESEIDTAQVGS